MIVGPLSQGEVAAFFVPVKKRSSLSGLICLWKGGYTMEEGMFTFLRKVGSFLHSSVVLAFFFS